MKRIVLTGGSSGIGLGLVKTLASAGHILHVMAIDSIEQWHEVAGDLAKQIAYYSVDMSNYEEATIQLNEAAGAMGGLDILINNAGVMGFENAHGASPAAIRRHLSVNLEAPIHLCARALSIMMAQEGGGQIVNIASVAALKPTPKLAVYAASKAGLLHYTRCIAAEYASKKIRANVICPGAVETGLTNRVMFAMIKKSIPMCQFQTPEEIASLVLWLLSEEARNVTGGIFSIDGGMSL